jgi:endonuclease/exonuclease/phosphatase family metal-dependent hydrolase
VNEALASGPWRDTPVLYIGDLNAGPDAAVPAFAELIGPLQFRMAEPTALLTWDPANPLVRLSRVANQNPAMIDHCLLRDGSSLHWSRASTRTVMDGRVNELRIAEERTPLSDHYGLECELELDDSRP